MLLYFPPIFSTGKQFDFYSTDSFSIFSLLQKSPENLAFFFIIGLAKDKKITNDSLESLFKLGIVACAAKTPALRKLRKEDEPFEASLVRAVSASTKVLR